jgi:hypothetical protein
LFQTKNDALQRMLFRTGFGHRFYTPESYDDVNPKEFDRPYAGWMFLDGGVDLFYGQRHWVSAQLDLGVVGPAAQAAEIQTFWHYVLNYDLPRGWDSQIANTPAVNLHLRHAVTVLDHRYVQLMLDNAIMAGTIRNYVRPGGTFRLGRLHSLWQSNFTGGNLYGNQPGQYSMREFYLLAGVQYEYVIHNTLIEGNFIGPPSPHTEEAEPWVRHEKYGFGFSRTRIDLSLVLHRLTREVTEGERHRYLTLKMSYRF